MRFSQACILMLQLPLTRYTLMSIDFLEQNAVIDPKSITATQAVRNFSEVTNQVRYRLVEFDVTRGEETVPQIVPATMVPSGVPINELNELFHTCHRLRTVKTKDGAA